MKKTIILTALLGSLSLMGCKTTIPERDTVDPTLTVSFNGDRLSYSDLTIEGSEFDAKAIYVKRNVEYTILFSGKDAGGVKEITFTLPNENVIELPDGIPENWTESSILDRSNRVLKYTGDPADPRSAAVFAAKFIPKNMNAGSTENADLNFEVIDFHDNTIIKTLRMVIGPGPTRVGPR